MASLLLATLLSCLSSAAPPVRRVRLSSRSVVAPDDPAFIAKKFKWRCELCALQLEKKKHLEEHLIGKRHQMAQQRGEQFMQRYSESGWYDAAAPASAVVNAFSFNAFLDGLMRRTRRGGLQPQLTADGDGCISPHVSVADLDPSKRAMLFRYLDEHIPETRYAEVLLQLEQEHGARYTRVKEILESVETYRKVVEFVRRPRDLALGAPSNLREAAPILGGVHDVACGHGLVGLLLVARYREVPLISSDLRRRESYDAHLAAYEAIGHPLQTASFAQGNFTELYDRDGGSEAMAMQPGSLVLCVHGCGTATRAAIQLARAHDAGWLVVPCCMPNDDAPSVRSMHVSDEMRYAMLCGSLAASYEAKIVWSLEPRVTPRSIVLGDLPPGV